MKLICNRKLYDSESAKRIWNWDNGRHGNDFNMVDETLYLAKDKEFFVFKEYHSSSEIVPVDALEILDWLELRKADMDKFVKENDPLDIAPIMEALIPDDSSKVP